MTKGELVSGLLFTWACYGGCIFAGVFGVESKRYWLIALSIALGLVGGISQVIGPLWLW